MHKIIIIEDDPIIAHIYRTRLEKEGYHVEICADGQTGFYRIHEFRPDAVLLDLMLPKLNGVDILKRIRAEKNFAQIPIMVFTNAYVPNMIQEAFAAGASQVFNKATLTPRSIIDALHAALANSEPTDGSAANASSATRLDPGAPFTATKAAPSPFPNTSAIFAAANSEEAEFQSELYKAFKETTTDTLTELRKNLQDFTKAADEPVRLENLMELYRKMRSLSGSAGIAGYRSVAQMAAALEVLLKELHEKPKNINASTLRTVAFSIDFIAELLRSTQLDVSEGPPFSILVVDDEILSRRAITYALEKAGLKSVSVEDSMIALNLVGESSFDLIFLDVQMPGMDGFDLCTKIRSVQLNKATPIIFVTSLTDFKSRAKSSLSGGSDLIAKPFMFIELSVKALTYVLRGRLLQKKKMSVAA